MLSFAHYASIFALLFNTISDLINKNPLFAVDCLLVIKSLYKGQTPMDETKIVKAKCQKTGIYYGLTVKRFQDIWKVVDVIPLTQEQGKLLSSEVKQSRFETNSNLLPCYSCGSRIVGGCKCPEKTNNCSPQMGYHFNCVYCQHLKVDYSKGRMESARLGQNSGQITLEQGKKVKITFSNVKWKKYDKIQHHTHRLEYAMIEPKVHVIANEDKIEFHGYNVSEMDEGVYYTIDGKDDFEISCDVNTSTIQPHPGGCLSIEMGIITAKIDQGGGSFFLAEKPVARVGAQFSMTLSVTDGGRYMVVIDGSKAGEMTTRNARTVDIRFGFTHSSHDCSMLSHAYISDIQMSQTRGGSQGKQ